MKWYDVPQFEGLYKINENGQVKSLSRVVGSGRGSGMRVVPEKEIATFKDKRGYEKVQLFKNGKKKTLSIKKVLRDLKLV